MDLDSSTLPAKTVSPWLHTPEALAKAAETRAITRREKMANRNEFAMAMRGVLDERLFQLIEDVFSDTERGYMSRRIELMKWIATRAFGKVPQEIILDTEENSFEGIMRRIAEQQAVRASAAVAEVVHEGDVNEV